MGAVRWAGFAAGLTLIVATAGSVVMTLVVPRNRSSGVAAAVWRGTGAVARTLSDLTSRYEAKDRLLAVAGPASLLALFAVWLGLFLVGYALVLWPIIPGGFPAALRQSGSSLFTLGIAASPRGSATVADFAAAATGLVVVALEIAYLPTIYGAFNRRETLVTTLESRAGVPAWGPEILARHELVGITGSLPDFYAAWEQWAADLAETHSSYPVLIRFRSPHPLRSWVIGLLAVLDSAALYLAFSPGAAPSEARLCLRMGFTSLRSLADVEGVGYEPDPRPDAPVDLDYEQFLAGAARLEEAGFALERPPAEAWSHFRGWRVNYESIAYQLAERLSAVPAPWSGPRRRTAAIEPLRPLDRTPDDPDAQRHAGGRWKGPARPAG